MNTTDKLTISADAVDDAFRDSLYKDEELVGLSPGEAPPGVVAVEGIVGRYGFHPERLEGKRLAVLTWVKALPTEFHKSGGGGWSFLHARNQADGRQWTRLHQRIEQLFCLAVGLGLAECQLPREMWSTLPGGVPYYVVLTE